MTSNKKQLQKFWALPTLDRTLVGIEEYHEAHLRNASSYYGWAIAMAASGHDPQTPKEPMRLTSDRLNRD